MAGLRVPLSTLRLRPRDRRRMTRGQDDWLGLSCATLSFATLCRFSTAHCASGEPLLAGHATIAAWPKGGEAWGGGVGTRASNGTGGRSWHNGRRASPSRCELFAWLEGSRSRRSTGGG